MSEPELPSMSHLDAVRSPDTCGTPDPLAFADAFTNWGREKGIEALENALQCARFAREHVEDAGTNTESIGSWDSMAAEWSRMAALMFGSRETDSAQPGETA